MTDAPGAAPMKAGSQDAFHLPRPLEIAVKSALAVATYASFAWLWSPIGAVIIMALIWLHEMGHVWAMRIAEVPDRGFVFLPFLGGAAGAKEPVKDRRKWAFIALGGPAVGFLVPLAALIGYGLTGSLTLAAAASITAGLNLAQLFPLPPLDGGHLVRMVFRSRVALRERVSLSTMAVSGMYLLDFGLAVIALALTIAVLAMRTPKPEDDGPSLTPPEATGVVAAALVLAALHLGVIALTADPAVRALEKTLMGEMADNPVRVIL